MASPRAGIQMLTTVVLVWALAECFMGMRLDASVLWAPRLNANDVHSPHSLRPTLSQRVASTNRVVIA